MSASPPSAQDLSNLFTTIYCGNAATALAVYDWLLCLGEEVTYIWKWRSQAGFALSSLVYAFTRYGLLIELLLASATNFSMSDLSCRANIWAQVVAGVLGTMAFSSFSALRAYALSNKNKWLTALIIFLALPPMAMNILQAIYLAPANQPSPFNCGASSSPPPIVVICTSALWRGSQLLAEVLVVSITWFYSYQAYRIRKGIKLGKTVSSLLLRNGSIYFLFLAILYILDIIFSTATVPDAVSQADGYLTAFYDPVTSILTCRFILLLRKFDSVAASSTLSFSGSRVMVEGDAAAAISLQFAAQPSSSLAPSIATFSHPLYVDTVLPETASDAMIDDDESE